MKLPFKERVFLTIVVAVLAAVLLGLAVLQYNWSNEVSAATSARLQANLNSSMFSWREDLNRELTSVFTALQTNPMPLRERMTQFAQQYQSWTQSAPHANLVSHVFLFDQAGTDQARLLQLDPSTGEFQRAEWPDDLPALHQWINEHSTDFVEMMHGAGAGRMRSPRHEHAGPTRSMGGHPPNRGWFGDVAMIDLNELALVRRQVSRGPQDAAISWIVVTLDRKVLQEHILPELVERYFSGSEARDYQVALVAAPGSSLVYTSDSGFGGQGTPSADETMPVFGPPRPPAMHKGAGIPPAGPGLRNQKGGQRERRELVLAGVRIGVLPLPGSPDDWQLLARHRKGSLESVVAGLRRRNLALSFGVLLVLAAGIGIIVISSQRARVLARLQMDFVAAVSHELRTPLAVISSAAENIADGLVVGKQQLSQYGTEIKNQAKHLMQLVEEILLFAATRDKRHHYNLRPLRVADVIEAALKDTAGLTESAGVTVEQEIAPNLPPVMGDLPALSHCLQNLITNAVKYGGDARWMRIAAKASEQDGRLDYVQISVEDRGLGIGSSELRRIFEPFYRSRTVSAAQIHGTGLGLSLARDIAQAMGGSLTVTSEPGKGSCFTIYLPFADVSQLQTSTQAAAAVNPRLSKT